MVFAQLPVHLQLSPLNVQGVVTIPHYTGAVVPTVTIVGTRGVDTRPQKKKAQNFVHVSCLKLDLQLKGIQVRNAR